MYAPCAGVGFEVLGHSPRRLRSSSISARPNTVLVPPRMTGVTVFYKSEMSKGPGVGGGNVLLGFHGGVSEVQFLNALLGLSFRCRTPAHVALAEPVRDHGAVRGARAEDTKYAGHSTGNLRVTHWCIVFSFEGRMLRRFLGALGPRRISLRFLRWASMRSSVRHWLRSAWRSRPT